MTDAHMKELEAKRKAFMDSRPDFAALEPEADNTETQLIIQWSRPGIGFGMLCFFEMNGVLRCDNEAMGRDFCKSVLDKLIDSLPANVETPPLIARFQTLDALLDAARPLDGEW